METVNDIIQDMRYAARLYLQGGGEGRVQFEMLDSYADQLDRAYKRDMQSLVDAGEIDMRTAMDEVTRFGKENARLKAALKEAIPWACLKCTFWNSRTARCSYGSGMCDQVWKWNDLLKGGAK